jgi:hypothetical protein
MRERVRGSGWTRSFRRVTRARVLLSRVSFMSARHALAVSLDLRVRVRIFNVSPTITAQVSRGCVLFPRV